MMVFWDKKNAVKGKEYKEESANLRIIGDRGSGKTGYMAALAFWPNANPDSPVQAVVPLGDNGQELIEKARNILEQGLELEPTGLDASPEDMKDYTISINLKNEYSWQKGMKLTINCKDYSGEFFRDLLHKAADPQLDRYLDDCLLASGILFLIDGTSYKKDTEYALGMEKFLLGLDKSEMNPGVKRRIALVITKCEQPELWVNRYKPDLIVDSRFPQTKKKLENWSRNTRGGVNYFITSAFGVLGTQYPEPNSKRTERNEGGTKAIIKDPRHWRPFGLVSPIYWLCTGKRHKQLDQI